MAEEERRNPMEREVSSIRSSSGGAGEPSSSAGAASSSVAVAGDQTNAQEDAQNNSELFPIAEGTGFGNSENYAAAAEDKHSCCVCKNEFKTKKALFGHMRTHPRDRRGLQPSAAAAATAAAAEQQGCDVRESAEVERRGCNVRESAAAEQSSPVRESVPNYQSAEDVKRRKTEYAVNQLLLLAEKSRQRQQGDDGGSSENNIASDNSTAGGGSGSGSGGSGEVIMKDGFNEPANISVIAAGVETGAVAGVAARVIIAACNGTVSDGKKGKSSKTKGSSSSAAGGSGAHTCEKCGRTFATGQSLGGHMRKHYDGPLIINKKRAREQQEETPAPAAERRVQEPAAPTGHTLALMAVAEESMASYYNARLELHNPALLSLSMQASDGGDYGRNREEPEGSSIGNGARRLHEFDLNEPAEPGEEPEKAPQPEPERKDDDGDDALLSFRLGHLDFRRSSRV